MLASISRLCAVPRGFGQRLASTTNNGLDLPGERYRSEHRESMSNPEEYWARIAENTVWTRKWDKVLDDSNSPFTKWFVGGRLNMCYNALDRHVEAGLGERRAVVWDSAITDSKSTLTYAQLRDQVSSLAAGLSDLGVGAGDRVVVYMPMIPEALVAMLAAARLGAVHCVVFGGFSPVELSRRIRHVRPKAIVTASCGIEPNRITEYLPIVEEALKGLDLPNKMPVIVRQRASHCVANLRPSEGHLDLEDVLRPGRRHDCVDVEANEPLYVLHTSGTTGEPKGIQHPTGGHAVVNKWTMGAIYGMSPGDVWWAASDIGWTVGHGYICYSPLLNCNTTVMYEGKPVGTPDAAQFFRVISEHGVKGMFVAPTALRAIKRQDPTAAEGKRHRIKSLEYLFVAGEHCDHETRLWAQEHFGVPVLDNWWQTETAHAITSTCVGLGNSLEPPKDVTGVPLPGFDVRILRDDGSEASRGELGRIVCKLPMAPGTMTTMFGADQRFRKNYFETFKGFYDTSDAGYIDEAGYVSVMARDDDVINVAGHRLSTAAMEEAVLSHEDIVDCAVVGVPDKLKGHTPLAIFIKKNGCAKSSEEISLELVSVVRGAIGPVAAFRNSVCVTALPRTRSGKTARKSIADMAAGRRVQIPPTIEDPTVYKEIEKALKPFAPTTDE